MEILAKKTTPITFQMMKAFEASFVSLSIWEEVIFAKT
jgi:hypothetical protein